MLNLGATDSKNVSAYYAQEFFPPRISWSKVGGACYTQIIAVCTW